MPVPDDNISPLFGNHRSAEQIGRFLDDTVGILFELLLVKELEACSAGAHVSGPGAGLDLTAIRGDHAHDRQGVII